MNIWAQLVIEDARDDERKTPLLHNFVLCLFRCTVTGFKPKVFYYLSQKLPLSQKLRFTSEGAVSHNVLYSFYVNNYFE